MKGLTPFCETELESQRGRYFISVRVSYYPLLAWIALITTLICVKFDLCSYILEFLFEYMLIATLYIVLIYYCKSLLNLKVYKSYIFPNSITSWTVTFKWISYQSLQQKWLFDTFLSANCRGHKDTGCPDANVYVLNCCVAWIWNSGSTHSVQSWVVEIYAWSTISYFFDFTQPQQSPIKSVKIQRIFWVKEGWK